MRMGHMMHQPRIRVTFGAPIPTTEVAAWKGDNVCLHLPARSRDNQTETDRDLRSLSTALTQRTARCHCRKRTLTGTPILDSDRSSSERSVRSPRLLQSDGLHHSNRVAGNTNSTSRHWMTEPRTTYKASYWCQLAKRNSSAVVAPSRARRPTLRVCSIIARGSS